MSVNSKSTPKGAFLGKTKNSLEILQKTKTHWLAPVGSFRAEKGTRTLDVQLGKLTLYQLSYFRRRYKCNKDFLIWTASPEIFIV